MGLVTCFRCGFAIDPCHCEDRRTFVKTRWMDYLSTVGNNVPVVSDPSYTPSATECAVVDERDSSAAAGSPLLDCHEKPAVRALDSWHKLYLVWRQDHPEVRGISWRCEHGPHDSTDTRGPVRRSAEHRNKFVLSTTWHMKSWQ